MPEKKKFDIQETFQALLEQLLYCDEDEFELIVRKISILLRVYESGALLSEEELLGLSTANTELEQFKKAAKNLSIIPHQL